MTFEWFFSPLTELPPSNVPPPPYLTCDRNRVHLRFDCDRGDLETCRKVYLALVQMTHLESGVAECRGSGVMSLMLIGRRSR